MAFEDAPTPHDYSTISEIARQMLQAADPSDAFDATDLLNKIEAGERAMVIRESGWQSIHTDEPGVHDNVTQVAGFAIAQDRAAGRVNGLWAAQRGNDLYVAHAARCLMWLEKQAREITAERGVDSSIIVTETGSKDFELIEALQDAHFEVARDWVIMQREITQADSVVEVSEGLTVRPIQSEADKQEAYRVLETSFQDHHNYFPEDFEEWAPRIELFPGHEWERDLLVEMETDQGPRTIGALVTGWLPQSRTALAEYLGITTEGRGKGAAKALMREFFRMAHEHGFPRAELTVDATSPTGAMAVYESMGWREDYRTQSWHKTVQAQ